MRIFGIESEYTDHDRFIFDLGFNSLLQINSPDNDAVWQLKRKYPGLTSTFRRFYHVNPNELDADILYSAIVAVLEGSPLGSPDLKRQEYLAISDQGNFIVKK